LILSVLIAFAFSVATIKTQQEVDACKSALASGFNPYDNHQ
jgi:hypothetical protein